MKLTQYQVDAFTRRLFGGNPAAVVPLETWLPDTVLQAIAEENNLSETAFFVPENGGFHLRWFTPVAEVDLCGHATLASAHVLFAHLAHPAETLRFHTRSGVLTVMRVADGYRMDFPASTPEPCDLPAALVTALGLTPQCVLRAEDYLVVLEDEQVVRSLKPDMHALSMLDRRGVIVTASGSDCDFVSRFFAPKFGIPEDPVTGSAHCQLMPYWAGRLGRNDLGAKQLSPRGGELSCSLKGDRVEITGQAVTFMEATIRLPY